MSIQGMSAITVSRVAEFVSYVEENGRGSDNLLFRGQRCDWPLLPKVARLKPRDSDLLTAEKRMFEEFKRQAPPFLEGVPYSDWEWLAVAQHHGMATRLLDWTRNPMAALWFVVRNPPESQGILWVLETDSLAQATPAGDPFACDSVKILSPRHIARRFVSQSAWFTVHYCTTAGDFVPLESLEELDTALTKITIEEGAFSELRWQLDRFGINAASLYPDLDGLCQYLEWLYSIASDER